MRKTGLWALALVGLLACGGDNNDDPFVNDDDSQCSHDIAPCPPNRIFDVESCSCVLIEPPDPCDECTENQRCEEDVCVDKPEGWVNPEELVGLTFAFMCILDGRVTQPPQGPNPGPYGDPCADILPIGFTILEIEEDGNQIVLIGATLDADGEYDPNTSLFIYASSADFSSNPTLSIAVEDPLEFEIEGITLRLLNPEITGVVLPDLSGLADGTMEGLIEPSPLDAVLGSPTCELLSGICNEDGLIPFRIIQLEAVRVGTTIPAP